MTIFHRPIETDNDRDFVISSWSSSYRVSYAAGLISMSRWASVMRLELGEILGRPNVRTLLAVEKTAPTFLYGFITADTTTQHERRGRCKVREWPALVYYCYVKAAYREHKIARGLFAALGIDPSTPFLYACKTPGSTRLANKIPLAKWNPLVARFAAEDRSNA
jgi:hypothetical protein